MNWGVLQFGVFIVGAYDFGSILGAPDSWKLPYAI